MAQVYTSNLSSDVPLFRILTDNEQSHQSHQDLVFVIRRQARIVGILRSSRGPPEQQHPCDSNALAPYTQKQTSDTRENGFNCISGERVTLTESSDSRLRTGRAGEGDQSGVVMANQTHREPDIRRDNTGPVYYRQNCYEYGRAIQKNNGLSGQDLRHGSDLGIMGAAVNYVGGGSTMLPFDLQ